MKKTVTTILSLALAIIMVSSLSSGVILAKGPSDNASDRGKERAAYHRVHEVVIFACLLRFPTQMKTPHWRLLRQVIPKVSILTLFLP